MNLENNDMCWNLKTTNHLKLQNNKQLEVGDYKHNAMLRLLNNE
jgi:hypothetical protein